ncbi:MAG: hypothetical protein ACFCUQ_03820 [Kiloniellales bacterium]
MELRARAELAARETCTALGAKPTDAQSREVASIIERAIADAVKAASRSSQSAARACCEADEDLAHKLAREIERANIALIANLSAMR